MTDAGSCFRDADARTDYQQTRAALKTYSDEALTREYFEYQKAGFDSMFGHNAREFFNLIADELISRGITQLPNIFGPIEVRKWKRA
jgi:hypothetical protein